MYSIQKALAVVFDGGASRGLIRGRLVSALLVLGALGLVLLAVIVSMLERDPHRRARRTNTHPKQHRLNARCGKAGREALSEEPQELRPPPTA